MVCVGQNAQVLPRMGSISGWKPFFQSHAAQPVLTILRISGPAQDGAACGRPHPTAVFTVRCMAVLNVQWLRNSLGRWSSGWHCREPRLVAAERSRLIPGSSRLPLVHPFAPLRLGREIPTPSRMIRSQYGRSMRRNIPITPARVTVSPPPRFTSTRKPVGHNPSDDRRLTR